MNDKDIKEIPEHAADRELDSLKPEDAAKAREVLVGIIERATERLTTKAEAHRERARVMAALAPDILAFDDSPDGERLRRFELASGRGLARSLGELRRHRSSPVVSGPLSVVSGPLSVVSSPLSVVSGPLSVVSCPTVGCKVDAISEVERDERTHRARENVTNEPTGGPLSVVRCPLPVVSCNVEAVDEANATNEPTNGPLSVVRRPLPVASCTARRGANESTAVRKGYERTHRGSRKRDERTHRARQNATNEPTGGPLSVVQLSVASRELQR